MQIVPSEFQDQLVRGLTHRMNNILTLFHGYLGLLLENKDLNKSTLDGLNKIKMGAEQASELIDRVHALAKPSATVLREIDLAEYLSLLRPGFEALCGPATALEIQVEDGTPRIQGDASRVRTAILELVKNAAEATEDSGGQVLLGVRVEQQKGSRAKWLIVSVTDNGPGVPEPMKDKIFTPFFTTKKKQNATGLGLTIVQSFVHQHGGSLRFESEPGKTTVEMRLPTIME